MRKPASLSRILTVLGLTGLFSSCIFEDRTCCFLSVGFPYTYHVKEADAFSFEVKDIALYIFDSEGVFVERFHEHSPDAFPKGYRMILPNLEAGTYTFLAVGRNRPIRTDAGEFVFPALEAGKSVLKDFTMRLNTADGVSASDFAALYDGVLHCELKTGAQYVDIPMVKLTNRIRVILMPYSGTETLNGEDYRFAISSGAVHLDYEGKMISPVPTRFQPFLYGVHSSPSASEDEVGQAIVADFHLSRLVPEDKPTLVITENEKEIITINLAWLLSLQGIAERRSEWSDQEYLDRQDAYSIIFFVDRGIFVKTRIIVNGWVLSMNDVSLG